MQKAKRIIVVFRYMIDFLPTEAACFYLWMVILIGGLCSLYSRPAAAMGPENIVVVINSSSADSLAIGNYYIELRNIPPTNVIYVPKVTVLKTTDTQSTQSWRFQREVLGPVWTTIKERGLQDQTQCIVYSAGFPSRIVYQAELKKYLLATGQKKNKVWTVPWASTTSVTYFREIALTEQTYMLTPDANWYAVDQVRNLLANPFKGQPAKTFDAAVKQFGSGQYESAAKLFTELVDQHPRQVTARYALVRALAKAEKTEEAIKQLKLCGQSGWSYREVTEKDPALKSLKQDSEYARVIEQLANLPIGKLPGRPFSSSQWWAKNGWPSKTEQQGRKYMMSTMLAIVRPDGSTQQQAMRQLFRSVAADGTNPKGVFFFAKHNDVRSRTRHRQIEQTAANLKAKGFQVVVSDQKWPRDKIDLLGATLGSAKIDWTKSNTNLVPGCLIDNLTSAGAIWPSPTQTQLTAHLNAGATGATGTVFEPYAIAAKFPTTRMHEHYVEGFSMAESIYQTVKSPYHLLVVGDPLCTPFGKFPKFKLDTTADLNNVDGPFKVQIRLKSNSVKTEQFELFFDGKLIANIGQAKSFSIDPSELSDGYHDFRIVGTSATAAANQTSKQLEIMVNRQDRKTTLSSRKSKLKTSEFLNVEVDCLFSDRVQIWHNHRILAQAKSGSKTLVDARKLGIGKARLFAVGIADDGSAVSSQPLIVEVVK
ncbi:tetratricopeptide repeat protein [Mariniblastus sp.]|nr:tetratricopeptide repeat protein [Mariniblastus sp.]